MTPSRVFASTIVAATIALFPTLAKAEDIGIVARDPNDPFVTRLVRELEHLGLTVARAPSVAASRDLTVLEIGDRVFDLYESAGSGGAGEGERKKRRLTARRDAVEVAEEVHALLLPLVEKPEPPAPPPVASVAPPPPAAADIVPAPPPASEARTFGERSVEISAGAGAVVGTSEPGLSILLAASVFPRALRSRSVAFGVSLGGIVPAAPEGVSSTAGSTDVRAYVGALEAIARFGSASPIVVDTALGVSMNHVTFAGSANAPFTSRDENATSVSPTLRVRAAHGFGAVGLFLDARAGVAFPEIAVRFAGADVATWGRPWACFGGGVALAF